MHPINQIVRADQGLIAPGRLLSDASLKRFLHEFECGGPTLLSFSGGRTSGLMLYLTLAAHGGTLPPDVVVTFFNTGKEKPETLDFVDACAKAFGVPIVWLEWRPSPRNRYLWDCSDAQAAADGSVADALDDAPTFAVVDYATASRDGKPFAELIRAKRYLPNVVTRFCTTEMKIRTGKRYMLSIGAEHWDNYVGLRADEPKRLARARNAAGKERWTNYHPLADAGVTLEHVNAFWRWAPFDLQLRADQGNCDLCFLKGKGKLLKLIEEDPTLAAWWAEQERSTAAATGDRAGARFRDRYTYEHLQAVVTDDRRQGVLCSLPLLDVDPTDEIEDCHCTD